MYIWVLLATFMAALYSFNIAYRSDMQAMQTEPVAQAIISKLIIQQQSAALYVAANTPPQAKYSNGTAASQIIYSAGIIEYDNNDDFKGLNAYLPYGYNYDGNIASEIYCLKKDNLAAKANQCSDGTAIRYLITYMQIPQRWLNVVTKKPNNDFINAVKEAVGLDTTLGYVDCAEGTFPNCTKFAINGVDGIKRSYIDSSGNTKNVVNIEIPKYIAENGGFKTKCVTSKKTCLAQIFSYSSEIQY